MKQYGYIEPVIESQDYILGAERSAPFDVTNESGDWRPFLPDGEPQRRSEETNGCTNFGFLNQLEILSMALFRDRRNWAERFLAVISGQTRQGNDPQKPMEAARKNGLVEEYKLPFLEGMSFEQYLSPQPMTKDYISDASRWLDEYELKHEYIWGNGASLAEKQKLLLQALKRSPVGISVYAWERNGQQFVKPQGAKDNHWCVLVHGEEGRNWWVFDSYDEDGNFLKELAWNFDFGVAKGISLRQITPEERAKKRNIFFQILNILAKTLGPLAKLIPLVIKPPESPVVKDSPKIETLAQAIETYENVDKSLNNPGGLRYSPFQSGYVVQSATGKRLSKFASYEEGYKALLHQIRIVCEGRSPAYNREAKDLGLTNCGELTLSQFLHIYAPKSENDTATYLKYICNRTKVEPTEKMKNYSL